MTLFQPEPIERRREGSPSRWPFPAPGYVGHGNGVAHQGVAGHYGNLLDEGIDQSPPLGQLALFQEVLSLA